MDSIPTRPCTTSEAARLLGVNEGTARKWADAGRLRVVRTLGGLRLFDRTECARLGDARATKKDDERRSR